MELNQITSLISEQIHALKTENTFDEIKFNFNNKPKMIDAIQKHYDEKKYESDLYLKWHVARIFAERYFSEDDMANFRHCLINKGYDAEMSICKAQDDIDHFTAIAKEGRWGQWSKSRNGISDCQKIIKHNLVKLEVYDLIMEIMDLYFDEEPIAPNMGGI